jgi:hypothetical protein
VSCFHKATNICTLAYNSLSQNHIFVNNFKSPSCFHNHRIIYIFETTKYASNENLATCFAIYLILREIIHITHFWEYFTFHFILSSFVKSIFLSHALAKYTCFKQPMHRYVGQLLLTKINLWRLSIWRQHLQSEVIILAIEKIILVLIWEIGMPKMCFHQFCNYKKKFIILCATNLKAFL